MDWLLLILISLLAYQVGKLEGKDKVQSELNVCQAQMKKFEGCLPFVKKCELIKRRKVHGSKI